MCLLSGVMTRRSSSKRQRPEKKSFTTVCAAGDGGGMEIEMKNECLILGGLVPDIYYRISSWPERGQDGFLSGEEVKAGGCAVNMAVTAENLGVRAHVVSCVGNDGTASMLRDYLRVHGLSERFIVPAGEASGKCFVFVEPDGERTFLTCKGAEGLFPVSLAEKIRKESFAAAGVTGYYLLNDDAELIMDVIEDLSSKGTQILFDPSPLAGGIRPELLERMIAVSDIMTPNLTELEILEEVTGRPKGSLTGGPRGEGGWAQEEKTGGRERILIVKDGAEGGSVFHGGAVFRYEAEKCHAVDTTGAGDSFSGALLYGLTQNMDIRRSVRLAARCAAKTVSIVGPHGFWKPDELAGTEEGGNTSDE